MFARTDRLLAVLAFLAWAVAGAPRIAALFGGRHVPSAWLVLYAAFGACLGAALSAQRRERALLWTIAQTAIALGLLAVGMPHFEGALLAVIAAQLRTVAAPAVAWPWIVGQAVPLFVTILPTHQWLGSLKATLEYLAFGAFAMTLFDLRHRERAGRIELARINAELLATRELLAQAARGAEQNRIRRELHDDLGQHLAALSMHLELARTDREHLARAQQTLDELQRSARATLAGLDPAIVDLEAALASLARATPSVRIDLEIEALRDLRPDAGSAVFRMVQEAVTNAYKHGAAREVRVRAEADEAGWTICVANDGRTGGAIELGRGLRGMRERLAAVGADLRIEVTERFALVASIPREQGDGT